MEKGVTALIVTKEDKGVNKHTTQQRTVTRITKTRDTTAQQDEKETKRKRKTKV